MHQPRTHCSLNFLNPGIIAIGKNIWIQGIMIMYPVQLKPDPVSTLLESVGYSCSQLIPEPPGKLLYSKLRNT